MAFSGSQQATQAVKDAAMESISTDGVDELLIVHKRRERFEIHVAEVFWEPRRRPRSSSWHVQGQNQWRVTECNGPANALRRALARFTVPAGSAATSSSSPVIESHVQADEAPVGPGGRGGSEARHLRCPTDTSKGATAFAARMRSLSPKRASPLTITRAISSSRARTA